MQIRNEEGLKRVILDEIDILLIESTAVSITAALLSELVNRKVKVIFCDCRHFPIAELISYHGCHDSPRKLRRQLSWSDESKRNIWRSIVVEKINKQALLLRRIGKIQAYNNLVNYANGVMIGDSTNREGLAAKQYFATLFGSDFTRDKKCDINVALDYGYQIMLSVFAREIVSAGFVMELGIFHNNIYNSFNLASDLIEPFRPLVDALVRDWFSNLDQEFDQELKRKLVSLMHQEVVIDGNTQTVINAVSIYVRSVFDALSTNDTKLLKFYRYEF